MYKPHTIDTVSFNFKGVYHAQYNMESFNTHENVWYRYHCNCAGLILDLEDQSVYI